MGERKEIKFDAETVIADFLGDIKDRYPGRELDSTDYDTCLKPLARQLLADLRAQGIEI